MYDKTSVERIGDAYIAVLRASLQAASDPCDQLGPFDADLTDWCERGGATFATPTEPPTDRLGVADSSDVESAISRIWSEVLGHNNFDRSSNFFAVGGTSLSAMVVSTRAMEFGLELSAEALFAEPTVAALAANACGTDEPLEQTNKFSVRPIDRTGRLPVSWAQKRLLFLERLNPGTAIYNVPLTLTWNEHIQPGAMQSAIERLAERQEVLRSRFVTSPAGLELFIESQLKVDLGVSDLTRVTNQQRAHEIKRIQRRTVRRPFDLSNGPLLRGHLVLLGQTNSVLFLCLHHSVTDALSAAIIERELRELYEAECLGDEPNLPVLEAQFVDFVAWQRRRSTEDARELHIAFWRDHLAGAPFMLSLPTDFPRPSSSDHRGQQLRFELSEGSARAVRDVARTAGTTPFVVLLATYAIVLASEANSEDLVVGVPVAGRPHRAFEELIGFFSNTLPLRLRVDGCSSFIDFVNAVRARMAEALGHQELPFESIVQELNPERSSAWHPLFQTMFAYSTGDELSGIDVTRVTDDEITDLLGTAKFDLTLFVREAAGFDCAFEFRCDLFTAETVRRLRRAFCNVLDRALATPQSTIRRLLAATPEDLCEIAKFNMTNRDFGDVDSILDLIDLHRVPFVAVEQVDGTQIGSVELLRHTDALAARLISEGCLPGDKVAIVAEANAEMIATLLAVWQVGASCVTIDPAYPPTRIAFMLSDSGSQIIVGRAEMASLAPTLRFIDWAHPHTKHESKRYSGHPDDIAYIIYTSGSTGWPKPIAMTHRGLTNLVSWQTNAGSAEGRRTLQFSSSSFDVFFQEVLVTLATKGTLCLIAPHVRRDPSRLLEICRTRRIERLFLPYVALRELAEAGQSVEPVSSLVEVITAGEQLQVTTALRQWFSLLQGCVLINHYGPAETHVVTQERLAGDPSEWPSQPPIGYLVDNCHAHVLDPTGDPCRIGIAGELFLSGACIARGYLNRPGHTAERFLPAIDASRPGQRMYRTGDRARWLPDGRLQFLGRLDNQTKIRGYRVEPSEIEAVLHTLDGVAQAVVEVRSDGTGENRLVAFVLPQVVGARLDGLRDRLVERMPSPFIPDRFVLVDGFERTPSGKIDRQGLKEPALDLGSPPALPPMTKSTISEIVSEIWREILGLTDIDGETNFFTSGGHSLSALRLITRISGHLGSNIPVQLLFDNPRLSDFARAIDRNIGSNATERHASVEIVPRNGSPLPASFMQQRMWLRAQITPGDPSYNLCRVVWLHGRPDISILRESIRWLANRHEVLRSRLANINNEIVQVIGEVGSIPIDIVQMNTFGPAEVNAEYAAMIEEELHRGFELADNSLFRATAAVFGDTAAAVILSMHHAVSDGHTLDILERELVEGYNALMDGDHPAQGMTELQFADFANYEKKVLTPAKLAHLLEYWKEKIEGYPTHLQLAPRRTQVSGSLSGRMAVKVGGADFRVLQRISNAHNCTIFATAAAVYAFVLSRISGQQRLLIGIPWGLRDGLIWEEVAGPFVNTLAIPFEASPSLTFSNFLQSVRSQLLAGQQNSMLPFEHLVDAISPQRHGTAPPVVQFAFGLHHTDKLPTGLSAQGGAGAKFDGSLVLFANHERIEGVFEYNRAALSDGIARTLVREFTKSIGTLANAPERKLREMCTVDNKSRTRLRAERPFASDADLTDLVAAHATERRLKLAVEAHDGTFDYATLDSWSNFLARRLLERPTRHEARIGVYIGNSRFHPLALLAIQKAGQVYVPLDPALPKERLSRIVGRAGIDLVLTMGRDEIAFSTKTEVWWLDQLNWRAAPAIDSKIDPRGLAYILFTSGSTGLPKGVMIERGGVRSVLAAQAEYLRLGVEDRLLKVASPSFDAAIFEMLATLGAGATLCLVPEKDLLPGRDFFAILKERQITAMVITPSALALVPFGELPSLKLLCVAGETCPAELVERWAPGRRMLNLYGPTETTIWATCAECAADGGAPSIGRPLPDVEIRIVDEALEPVAEFGAGELLIGGAQVARGYLDDPGQTANGFIPDWQDRSGARLYRTGDLVRLQADGTLEFLGRIDEQIKIRGVRIEPREIETVILSDPSIAVAIVIKHDVSADDPRLVAYVAPYAGMKIDVAKLSEHLAVTLPQQMLPSDILVVPHMPLTASGKIARNMLPHPPSGPITPASQGTNEIENTVCAICSELLSRTVEPNDNFFAVGGHSLLAVRLVAAIETRLGYILSPTIVFEAGTIREICARLRAADVSGFGIPRLQRIFAY